MLEKELIQILSDELDILQKLLAKEKEKREVVILKEYSRLKKIDEEERELFSKLEKLELERLNITKRLAQKFSLESEINLSKIIPFLNNQTTLIQLRDKLLSTLDEIRLVCLENKIIIESSISVSLAVVEKITNTTLSEVNYNSEGKKVFKDIDITTYSTIS
jgi:flagellar biosynthesis/type III secretory pathway chaperone